MLINFEIKFSNYKTLSGSNSVYSNMLSYISVGQHITLSCRTLTCFTMTSILLYTYIYIFTISF